MDHMHLNGAEDVRRAGYQMAQAGERMAQAAASIEESLHRHRVWMDEWLARYEAAQQGPSIVNNLAPVNGLKPCECLTSKVLEPGRLYCPDCGWEATWS